MSDLTVSDAMATVAVVVEVEVEGDYPWPWEGFDFTLENGHRVRVVAVDIDCPGVDVYLFGPRGHELSKASFTNVAAPLVVTFVAALIEAAAS